jgi:predicted DCC family thiol-disulfide oxidoreductase YuxK
VRAREIAFLRRRDRRGAIAFEDIALLVRRLALRARPGRGDEPDPRRASDGTVIEGVEVFRRLDTAIGLGWLVAPTRWPLLRGLFERAYRVFARNRLRWTGREDALCAADRCERAGT